MTTRPEVDVVVIGAGVIGLACAAALARRGASVVVLEREGQTCTGVTSRNSQVVHAGIYNPVGSLKSLLCVEGRHDLVERCQRWNVPYQKVGKLIVASEAADQSRLEELFERGRANGVEGLRCLNAAQVQAMEPQLHAAAAIESPETGIVDAVAYARSFWTEAEQAGAVMALCSEVTRIEAHPHGYHVVAHNSESEESGVLAAAVVNAAGLDADDIAGKLGIDVDDAGYRLHRCKGDYFSLAPGRPLHLTHLIYPLPEVAGLGIHTTLDLDGRLCFGPDTEYVDKLRFDVDPAKAEAFSSAIGRYLPEVKPDWLVPDFAGIRPKLAGPGEAFRDFVIEEESARGFPGFVNLIGIESPGLTAATAIARRVSEGLSNP
jgi:L-2-hydroxyglutarate oxidase LhgO